MFESLLLQKANTRAKAFIAQSMNTFSRPTGFSTAHDGNATISSNGENDMPMSENQLEILRHLRLPGVDVDMRSPEGYEINQSLDAFTDRRKFNPVDWCMDNERELTETPKSNENRSMFNMQRDPTETDASLASSTAPEQMSIHLFQEKFGCSMLKSWHAKTNFPSGDLDFQDNLDIWGEMPKYSNDMYFLYLIIRRRNTYAVIFDINGKCIHSPMSAGKVGLKNSDKGWRSEGSASTGNIVTSKYLDLVYPKLCSLEESQSRQKTGIQKGRRPIQVVLRVMGWYNGRQGALKALHDRKDKYHISYFEDITPIPRNGPKMPKLKRR